MIESLIAFSERIDAENRLPKVLPWARLFKTFGVFFLINALATTALSQTHTYPKEIRGYKVERTVVEVKKRESRDSGKDQRQRETSGPGGPNNTKGKGEADVDALIKLGQPQLARVTPLGITFEVPIVVSPVKQSGHVDFLVFEDMVVNGTSIDINE